MRERDVFPIALPFDGIFARVLLIQRNIVDQAGPDSRGKSVDMALRFQSLSHAGAASM